VVNTPVPSDELLVTVFLQRWTSLAEPGVGESLLCDPVLVLGPGGTHPVARDAFLSAVTGRGRAVADAGATTTSLTGIEVVALGAQLLVATAAWTFTSGAGATSLVSDFLLQREADGLRCAAYLPRTNVLEHLD
jgi:hypothetical protein